MIEHVGKAIDALKTQPILLLFLIFNAMVLAGIYFAIENAREQHHQELIMVMDKCLD